MRLSVVVVNWSSRDDLRLCLDSLRAQTYADLQVIVVDNGSSDGSPEMVRAHFPEHVLLAQPENLGFAEACNRGIIASDGEWVATLNNDAVAEPDWAASLAAAAAGAAPGCGMLQSLMLFSARPGIVNSTGIELMASGGGRDRLEGRAREEARREVEIFCPSAGAAAYRRVMLDEIQLARGYFDPEYFMYSEDLDLGWRARLAGFSARYVPGAVVRHRWHGSSERHGEAWLMTLARTNRIRTLLKNASWSFVLRSLRHTASAAGQVGRHGGARGLRALASACESSLDTREQVSALATLPRDEVERRWVIR